MHLHGGRHHDHAGDGDQHEVERVHEACPCGLLDLGTAVAAQRAGRRAAAARQLREERHEMSRHGQLLNWGIMVVLFYWHSLRFRRYGFIFIAVSSD